MYDIMSKYADYESIVKTTLLFHWIALFFFAALLVGTLAAVVWCHWEEIRAWMDPKATEKPKITRSTGVKWIVSVLLLGSVSIGGICGIAGAIADATHDLNNNDYVVISNGFTVIEEDWWGRWNSTTYVVRFTKDGKIEEISPDLKQAVLTPGEYTNTVLVYARRSEIVVDVFPKEE
ncbi:MAG: hypothetical protein IJZ13_03995 [Clostridia bacterium]|nr:hypothetical protein [Clostridia bacterium]